MFTSRRRANKTLLGTRVCAPWKDGFFYSGIIEAVKSKPAGENTYTILFDDGYIAEVDEEEIVGPGFANSSSVQLRKGQLVYISFKGREVAATVLKNKAEFGEILVTPKHEHKSVISVKAGDVHLTKGQKYCEELGDKVSESIMCPVPCKIKAHGADLRKNNNSVKIDENLHRSEEMAALVLTALSISPVVKEKHEETRFEFPPSPDSGSEMPYTYSTSPSNSPAGSMSPASPDERKYPQAMTPPSPLDEGISVEIPRREHNRKRKCSTSSIRTLYQCTWPGCGKTLSTAPGIIRHVRTIHLGPKTHSEDGYSDGEEEFYFNEIEAEIDDFGEAFPYPSPLALSPTPTQSHFDMVKSPWAEPMVTSESHQHNFSFNWDGLHSSSSLPLKPAPKPATPRNASHSHSHSQPHTQSFPHRKARGENKKCRKVYGMENRHMWCTQCRWKKACVRFLD